MIWLGIFCFVWGVGAGVWIAEKIRKMDGKSNYEMGWYRATNAYLMSINHPEFPERVEHWRLGYGPPPLPRLEPPDYDDVMAELKEKYG